jgi:methionyl-tRNA formyltransferase
MNPEKIKFVFFGSSRFSDFVLEELEGAGFHPLLKITDARKPLPDLNELKALEPNVFVVASFGKILPQTLLDFPSYGSLNVHPSLLPELRGPAPIQGLILGKGEVGVTIIKMDAEMDHGPIVAQEKVELSPWPDHYAPVEEKLARAGGKLLSSILAQWVEGTAVSKEQDHNKATFIKMIRKEDGLIDLSENAEFNYRKVLAYSTWPGAYFFFKRKTGDEVRIVVKDAAVKDGVFTPTRVIPAGKKEMDWQDFLRGNA